MRLLEKAEEIAWKIIKKLNLRIHYTSIISKKAPWAFVSYIPEACYRCGRSYLNGHQNRREMKRIVKVFNECGYNVYVAQHTDTILPDITPKIVFGLEPAFEHACNKWPNAIKIYYATGASYMHQNGMIKKRTDEFNRRYKPVPPYPYQRLTTESDRYELADYIFQIGSNYTIATYPKDIRSKIKLIRQSSTLIDTNNYQVSFEHKDRNVFLALVGAGPVLKGVDLLVEYFRMHPEYQLHLAGNIDEKFWKSLGGGY